jgi:OOP family OmpA-OmpF porin
MKKTICLVAIVFMAVFFSGCAGFLDKILVCEEPAVPVDSDGDGVPDCRDNCPDTPKGVAVDSNGCPLDSDGDGVPDYLDKCPDTPKGVAVDSNGCPLDSDGDGVPDYLDKCPGTLKGAPVNADGCVILKGLHFDTDKADLKPGVGYFKELNMVADVLIKNPDVKGEILGHTDNVGSAEYNQKLSERRAESVKAYLVNKGIAAERIVTKGLGLTQPMASNDTVEGRAQNRRVQFKRIK